ASDAPVRTVTDCVISSPTCLSSAVRSRIGNRPAALRIPPPAATAPAARTTAGAADRAAWKRSTDATSASGPAAPPPRPGAASSRSTRASRTAKSPGWPRRAADPNVTGRRRPGAASPVGAGPTVLHPEPGRVVPGGPGPADPAGGHGLQGPRDHHRRPAHADDEPAHQEQERAVAEEPGAAGQRG